MQQLLQVVWELVSHYKDKVTADCNLYRASQLKAIYTGATFTHWQTQTHTFIHRYADC